MDVSIHTCLLTKSSSKVVVGRRHCSSPNSTNFAFWRGVRGGAKVHNTFFCVPLHHQRSWLQVVQRHTIKIKNNQKIASQCNQLHTLKLPRLPTTKGSKVRKDLDRSQRGGGGTLLLAWPPPPQLTTDFFLTFEFNFEEGFALFWSCATTFDVKSLPRIEPQTLPFEPV